MDRVGDKLDIKEFHNVILANGPISPDVLQMPRR
jgi:uncharacterized protein (DUF885 family)